MFEGELVNDDVNTIMPFPNSIFYFEGIDGENITCILSKMNGKVYSDELPRYVFPGKTKNGTLYDVLTDDYNAARISENFDSCMKGRTEKYPELKEY